MSSTRMVIWMTRRGVNFWDALAIIKLAKAAGMLAGLLAWAWLAIAIAYHLAMPENGGIAP